MLYYRKIFDCLTFIGGKNIWEEKDENVQSAAIILSRNINLRKKKRSKVLLRYGKYGSRNESGLVHQGLLTKKDFYARDGNLRKPYFYT